MVFREIFRKLIKIVKSIWLFILKTYALNLRLMKAEVIWFLLRKEKIIIITSPTSFFFKIRIQLKKLTNYAEHANTSNATWNKIHLICRFFIIMLSQRLSSRKWHSTSSMWVTSLWCLISVDPFLAQKDWLLPRVCNNLHFQKQPPDVFCNKSCC